MSWKGESWADVVARASEGGRHRRTIEREDAAALAARAKRWFLTPGVTILEDGLRVGETPMSAIEIGFAQLYHVEPVDPWPSLALGWVDGHDACATVLTPEEPDAASFARDVADVVDACEDRVPTATSRGWLAVPIHEWEKVDALPGEGDEKPAMLGYRTAPAAPDPVVARRVTAPGMSALWTWVWARLKPVPRRVEAKEVVVTKRFVYVRTRHGARLRMPIEHLRTARRTADGDTIYVLGRNTELLLTHQPECPVVPVLDARVA